VNHAVLFDFQPADSVQYGDKVAGADPKPVKSSNLAPAMTVYNNPTSAHYYLCWSLLLVVWSGGLTGVDTTIPTRWNSASQMCVDHHHEFPAQYKLAKSSARRGIL
jgi:hypothetical protein